MRFKAFEVYLNYGDHNTSMRAIEERADNLVNAWLAKHGSLPFTTSASP